MLLELGSALIVCQRLEGSLVFLLSVCSMEDADMAEGSFEAALDLLSQKTMGRLLKRLKGRVGLQAATEAQFRAGWNSRNWIVHEFLRSTAEEFRTSAGRLRVLKRLASEKEEIKKTHQLANQILDTYLADYGIAIADPATSADRIWTHLNAPLLSDEN